MHCDVLQKRLQKQLNSTLRMANKAQQKLQHGDDDEDTVGGITQLIEEAMNKHEQVRHEMGSHGVTVPMSTAVTDSLSTALHTGTGQRMAMERQVGDIQEACRQLKVRGARARPSPSPLTALARSRQCVPSAELGRARHRQR